jgi:hypothetical protein
MIEFGLAGIGLLGPGLADWASGRAALHDPSTWVHAPTMLPAPARLPANERRRAGPLIRAALAVADQAVAMAGAEPATLATVFASSTSEPGVCHEICEALARPERLVSPTRFTNSVHNAAAGYWHIATQSMAPSTSLAAFDASFGAGLLEAAVQCVHGRRPVLLVGCDVPYPEPLHALRAIADGFAVALLLVPLAPADGRQPWRARLDLPAADTATPCAHRGLEATRRGNPAARALPLLQALAGERAATIVIEAADALSLRLDLRPADDVRTGR